MALPRSSRGNTAGMVDIETGRMTAAPRPIRARYAISWLVVLAQPDSAEDTPKTIRPNTSSRLRPIRSPSTPNGSSSPARTSTYESRIHWSEVLLAPRSLDSVARATLRMVTSRPITRTARTSTDSTHHALVTEVFMATLSDNSTKREFTSECTERSLQRPPPEPVPLPRYQP